MIESRWVEIPVITYKNEPIPIWDSRISSGKDEGGRYLRIDGEYGTIYHIQTALWDLKEKKISLGEEIDLFPEKTSFQIEETVLYQKSHGLLKKGVIEKILYTEYETQIGKGSKLHRVYFGKFTPVPDQLYLIKVWKPFYKIKDGPIIEWEHQLYKFEE